MIETSLRANATTKCKVVAGKQWRLVIGRYPAEGVGDE